ncbi:tetratricopeptide repeat protein [Phocaeicola sp.]|uniref:tetratricopeptide repeat protein n=1 Tax=Phocaeicola sp. TaxID=2773926 RepID=UPI0023C73EE0|nr:tetratricopeptide repeat protein [Phocaeicola sp.]MDE5676253.1 tetratricopeptide repeat protein [Phocaeicola sp.]
MKSIHSVTIILVIVVFVFNACSTKEHSSVSLPELMQAEAIMYEHPDSALYLLQNMKVPSESQKLEHATWALLMTQAKYKMHINQNDSLVNIAYDYYMKQEDAQRKALVLYLKGGICKEQNKKEEAQKLFLDAAEYAEKSKNAQLCHLIYSHISNIYIFSDLNEYALTYSNKSYQYAIELNNPRYIISSLISLGRIHVLKKDYEQAIKYYEQAIQTAKSIHNRSKITHTSNEMAGTYFRIGNYPKALQYLRQAMKANDKKEIQGQIFLLFGKVYAEMEEADSAYHYLNKLLSFEKHIRTTTDAYYTLYELSKKEQKYEQATSYSDKLIIGLDSIHHLEQNRNLAEMQEKCNQQKLINERNQLKIEKDRNTRNALIVLIVFICAIAILIYNSQRKLMKKERIIQRKEEEIRRSMMQISENETTIRYNRLKMQELTAQIEINKDMQEQLEELNRTYTEMQQQNEALACENQTLQENITQYSSTLNAQSEELKKLSELITENQRLHDRERTLSKQLVKKDKVLKSLITAPKYIDAVQWKEIEEAINSIFDNFTERLLKKIPTLTEYEVHLCCLIKLNMSNTNMAIILGISSTSVSKQKYRLKEHIIQQSKTFKQNQTLDLWIWDL